jgi:hypothetical protein
MATQPLLSQKISYLTLRGLKRDSAHQESWERDHLGLRININNEKYDIKHSNYQRLYE